MGVEQQLMDHLAAVVDFQEGYAAAPAPWYAAVPTDFGGGTPNHKMLRMACLYLDAVVLHPAAYTVADTRNIVSQAFNNQFTGGHCVFANANEVLTPTHGQLWWAAVGAIQLGADLAADTTIRPMSIRWLRNEAVLCHLCGFKSGTKYLVVAPGARGASAHSNDTRDKCYHYLMTGTSSIARNPAAASDWRNRYYLGVRTLVMARERNPATFTDLTAGPHNLNGANNELRWNTGAMPKLKDAFKVERNAGNEHVASFSTLRALEPQWVGQVWHDPANNQNLAPKYIFYTGQAGLANGGACPEPIPTLGVTPFTWPGLP